MKINVLGIDFGLSKLGIAISESGLVSPHSVIRNTPHAHVTIANLCLENKIGRIVIGLPDKSLMAAATAFVNKVRKDCRLPVVFQDETLTTQDAVDRMIMLGKKKSARKKEDAFAAGLILEEYLARKEKHV